MKFFQSIRWKVQLWHSVLLAVIVSILGTLFYFHQKTIYLDSIDARILSILPLLPPRFSPNDYRPVRLILGNKTITGTVRTLTPPTTQTWN